MRFSVVHPLVQGNQAVVAEQQVQILKQKHTDPLMPVSRASKTSLLEHFSRLLSLNVKGKP